MPSASNNIEDHPNSENERNQVTQYANGRISPEERLDTGGDDRGGSDNQGRDDYCQHQSIGTLVDRISQIIQAFVMQVELDILIFDSL